MHDMKENKKISSFKYFLSPERNLPGDLTSYDFLKSIAIILMIMDHSAYYFFIDVNPEYSWARVLGRMCVPIWFFLIGYARSRDIGPHLWIGTAVLVLGNMIVGQFIFPLSILPTMIFIRIVIDYIMERAVKDHEVLIGIAFVIYFLSIPSGFIWEYGTAGLLFAMFGWMMRNPDKLEFKIKKTVEIYALGFCVIAFGAYQAFVFQFDRIQTITLFAGFSFVCLILYGFRPQTYPKLTRQLPNIIVRIIQVMGRRSLEVYVIHLTLFKFAAAVMGDERFTWFNFTLT